MQRSAPQAGQGTMEQYLAETGRYPLLSVDEEQRLARRFRDEHDRRAGHDLVTANLRFVVKVAYEYRSYGFRIADLVQEGNIGLMRAVQKFDPDKGIRLISYAVWWIRAYIQSYILRSWSLVKLGTTQAQRKLFFSLARTRRELDRASVGHGADSDGQDVGKIASKLRVKPGEVSEMAQRLDGRDLSLDAPLGDEGGQSHLDVLPGSAASQDDVLGEAQEQRDLAAQVTAALSRLDDRERFIIEQRVMTDDGMTLKELGAHFGFSRERARQLEIRAKEKLRMELGALAASIDLPLGARPVADEERAVA